MNKKTTGWEGDNKTQGRSAETEGRGKRTKLKGLGEAALVKDGSKAPSVKHLEYVRVREPMCARLMSVRAAEINYHQIHITG